MPEMGANLHPKWETSMTDPTGTPATGEPNADPKTDPPATPPANPPADPPKAPTETEKLQAEIDKWKAMSRKTEDALKAERDKAKTAGMSADEKAVAEAKAEGRKEAAKASGERLAKAELRSALATAGVTDPGDVIEDWDMRKFVDDDGEPNDDAITKAVKRHVKLNPPAEKAAGKSGGDFSGAGGAGLPISEAQLATMTKPEIAKAFKEGKLTHLM